MHPIEYLVLPSRLVKWFDPTTFLKMTPANSQVTVKLLVGIVIHLNLIEKLGSTSTFMRISRVCKLFWVHASSYQHRYQELLHWSCRPMTRGRSWWLIVHPDGKSRMVRARSTIIDHDETMSHEPHWLVIGWLLGITLHTIDGYWRAKNYNHIGWLLG